MYACRVDISTRKMGCQREEKTRRQLLATDMHVQEKGTQKPDKRYASSTKHHHETKANCKVGVIVKLVEGKFRITNYIEKHNHPLRRLP